MLLIFWFSVWSSNRDQISVFYFYNSLPVPALLILLPVSFFGRLKMSLSHSSNLSSVKLPDSRHTQDRKISIRWSIIHGCITFIDQACLSVCVCVRVCVSVWVCIECVCVVKHVSVNICSCHVDCFCVSSHVKTAPWWHGVLLLVHAECTTDLFQDYVKNVWSCLKYKKSC